jgi:uncharacterized membrane protein YoaK (UPF0700 family)
VVTSPQRLRDALLVVLAATTGAVDATTFERLGHVFASVLTGNLVVLGVSAVATDGRTAASAGCALGGYALGALSVARLEQRSRRRRARERRRQGSVDTEQPQAGEGRGRLPAPEAAGEVRPESVWPREVTRMLIADLVLLCAFSAVWEMAGAPRPGGASRYALLVLGACAMGIQSEAVRGLGGMSTTYLTSTITGLLESITNRRLSAPDEVRSAGIVVVALAGAGAATALLLYARAWLPALVLAPLALVAGTSALTLAR